MMPGAEDLGALVDAAEVASLERGGLGVRQHVSLEFSASEFAFWQEKVAVQRERRGEVLLLVERSDGDLLLHTKDHYPDGGWRLLSGGIRYDEEVLEALAREIHEETGVTGADFTYLGMLGYDLRHRRNQLAFASYLFHVPIGDAQPEVTDPDEAISGFRWVGPERLGDVAERLRTVEPPWRDWGSFRAVGHDFARHCLRALL